MLSMALDKIVRHILEFASRTVTSMPCSTSTAAISIPINPGDEEVLVKIIAAGVNIYPQETENVLIQYSKVMDIAVIDSANFPYFLL